MSVPVPRPTWRPLMVMAAVTSRSDSGRIDSDVGPSGRADVLAQVAEEFSAQPGGRDQGRGGRGPVLGLAWPELAWPGLAWPGLAWPGHWVAATVLTSSPIAVISMPTLSPGCRYFGGFMPIATPDGVPVAMMSPGSSVIPLEM